MSPRRKLPNDLVGDVVARRQIAGVLIWAAIWICGLPGAGMVVTGLVVPWADLVALGTLMVVIGVVALVQRTKSSPESLPLLLVTSVGLGLITPIVDAPLQVAVIPSLALLSFVAVLTLHRRGALRFSVWAAMVSLAVLPWILHGVSWLEYVVAAILVVFVFVTCWRLFSLATDLLIRGEESHRLLLEGSPVAILEEDYSEVAERLGDLRNAGVTDLDRHLRDHPAQLRGLVSVIRIRRANDKAVQMIGAPSVEALVQGFSTVDREESELDSFREQFVAMWENRTEVATDLTGRNLNGEPFEAVLHWSMPSVSGAPDPRHVIVTLSDIAPRKAVEERLGQLLESNQRLLESEHALVQSSRALLMGGGEEALDSALTSLREASGSDIAYLATNVEHPDLGPAFEVVRSVTRPGTEDDEWIGTVHPWSKYELAADALQKGQPFNHVATETPGAGWNRSLLSVPVFLGDRWAACVGFVDVARKRVWDDNDTRMLEVAAPMLGAFWEREMTTRRLEELIRSKDRFVASVSHELRTPLAAILGFAEELRAHRNSFNAGELTEMLELIATQSQEMADMVEDLLVSARAEIGRIAIRAQHVYLRAQAETIVAGVGEVPHKDIRVTGDRGKVWADPTRTRQIVRNLVTNAIKYGGDTVVVETVEGEGQTTLTVTDDGDGLDPSQWETIFEPYQRAHEALTQPASIGLGLTVSRRLARMMGGDLVYRCDESGSVFSLLLPTDPPQIELSTVSGNGLLMSRPGN